MGSEEPLTTREILTRFEQVDKRLGEMRDDRKNLDDRITKLAGDTVTAEAWGRENGHIQKDIAEVDAHCEDRHKIVMKALGDLKSSIEKRSEFTWTRAIGIAGILAVLAAAWYTALHQGGH